MHYLLVDTHNMLHRARHASRGDVFLQTGLALHIVLGSIRQAWDRFEAHQVVFCGEGKSWRKTFYPEYKANRAKIRLQKTSTEQEEDQIFFEMIDALEDFIENKTNCIFLKHPECEADDFIARFIQLHNQTPEDQVNNKFTIISADTDFQQLVSPNVQLYDGVQGKLTTHMGMFNDKGQPFKNKRGKDLGVPNPEWLLFEKCVRGDSTDNVESAYPGCRKKGSKNKVGMLEAFEDRHNQGWSWTNFMMQRWTDFDGNEHKVKDCYERNQVLIDLTRQPEYIKNELDKTIEEALGEDKHVKNVGIHFLKFCGLYELIKISQNPNPYLDFLSGKKAKKYAS